MSIFAILSNRRFLDKTGKNTYIMMRMRKEILFAILAGSALGLIIAFGIYRANSLIKPTEVSDTKDKTPSSAQNVSLTIANPESLDVITESPVEISGLTKAGVWVTTITDENDYLVQSGTDGSFKQNIELSGGANQISATSLDPNNGTSKQNLLLVFSTEFAKNLVSPSPTPSSQNSTTSGDSVREKVIEKIEKVLQNPKAYLGTVTDKTEQTIQIKDAAGEIKQISVSGDETTVVKTTPTAREVKLTDIAIGDFIVAMGFSNGNSVLVAKRILITPAMTEMAATASLSRVKKALAKEIESEEISTKETLQITPDKTLTVLLVKNGKKTKAKFADITEGDLIIAVGSRLEGQIKARTIFILSK